MQDDSQNRRQVFQGLKYFKLLRGLLRGLHGIGVDRSKNRKLHYDDYVALLLLSFFNPVLNTLSSLQRASEKRRVQARLGIGRTSMGSLSESVSSFDPSFLRNVVVEMARQAIPLQKGHDVEALQGLTAVDGTVLHAMPQMAWALGLNGGKGVRVHLHFEVFKAVPIDAEVTDARFSERKALENMLQPGRLYVVDRGYASFKLMRKILNAGSSFVSRVKESVAYQIAEERHLSDDALAAGVVRDIVISKLGTDHHKDHLRQPVRLVVVQLRDRDGKVQKLFLVTDRLDLSPELVALAYKYRWTIELFFRWFKHIMGCRHLISTRPEGVALQVYAALIACLLVVLWTGRKPNKAMLELLQLYLSGWATLSEVIRDLGKAKKTERREAP